MNYVRRNVAVLVLLVIDDSDRLEEVMMSDRIRMPAHRLGGQIVCFLG